MIMKTNWKTKKLGEIDDISFLRGNGLNKSLIDVRGDSKCILYGELYTKYTHPVITTVISKTNFKGNVRSEIGDVLVPGTTTADAYGIAIARSLNEKGVILGGDINILRTKNKEILADYLSFFLNGPAKMELALYATATNIIHLSNKKIQNIEIVYPSTHEQKRLVKILDEVFEKVTKAKESAEKNLRNSKELFESYSRTTFENPGSWSTKTLGEVCNLYQGIAINAKTRHALVEKSELPLLRIKDLKNNSVEQYIDPNNYPKNALVVESDLIYTRTGQIGLVFTGKKGVLHNNSFKIEPNHSLSREYLFYWLQNPTFKSKIISLASRAAQPDITHTLFKQQQIAIPSLPEQKTIVKKLEILSVETKKLEKIYEQKLTDLEELKKSVLQQAFTGKL